MIINQLALRARWLFYHFISNSGSLNNCYIVIYIQFASSVIFEQKKAEVSAETCS